MTSREAEETLSVIRTLMERGTRYTNLSGHAGIAAGATALVGSLLRSTYGTPFTLTWLGVLLVAGGASVFFTAAMARSNGEPFWTRQTRTVVAALTPAFVAALLLTGVMERIGREDLLPGIWMILWGVGALSMGFFTPRVISLLGAAFMAAGAITFFIPPVSDAWSMGLTFGAIHLAYGALLTFSRQSEWAAQPVFRHLC
jgi:hypothetical protein